MLTGRSCGSTGAMSRPPSRMRPSSGVSKPASMRSSVVLPQPLGPSSAKNSPALMSSESRSTARKLPNFLPPPRCGAAACRSDSAGGGLPPTAPLRRRRRSVDFRRFLGHVTCQPHRGCTLAADRHPLNRRRRAATILSDAARVSARFASHLRVQGREMNRDRYDLPLTTDFRPRRGALSRRRGPHAVGLARRRRRLRPRRLRRIRALRWRISRGPASIS